MQSRFGRGLSAEAGSLSPSFPLPAPSGECGQRPSLQRSAVEGMNPAGTF